MAVGLMRRLADSLRVDVAPPVLLSGEAPVEDACVAGDVAVAAVAAVAALAPPLAALAPPLAALALLAPAPAPALVFVGVLFDSVGAGVGVGARAEAGSGDVNAVGAAGRGATLTGSLSDLCGTELVADAAACLKECCGVDAAAAAAAALPSVDGPSGGERPMPVAAAPPWSGSVPSKIALNSRLLSLLLRYCLRRSCGSSAPQRLATGRRDTRGGQEEKKRAWKEEEVG